MVIAMKCACVIIPHCLVVSIHVSILVAITVLHSHYGLLVYYGNHRGKLIVGFFFFQIKNTTPTSSLKESSYRHILVHTITLLCVIV